MKKNLFICTQLPILRRYTDWWPHAFNEGLKEHFEVHILPFGQFYTQTKKDGVLRASEQLDPKNFGKDSFVKYSLDWESHIISQLVNLSLGGGIIKPDDVILCLDGCTPGLIASFLLNFKPCRTIAICHGSSFNTEDMFDWSRNAYDRMMLNVFDTIIVASRYHQHKLEQNGISPKILCSHGLPLYPFYDEVLKNPCIPVCEDKPSIAIIDRPGQKRNQAILDRVMQSMEGEAIFNDVFTSVSKSNCSFGLYLEALRQFSHVLVTTREETFGYQIRDALAMGVMPIVPRKFCFPEFVPASLCYKMDKETTLEEIAHEIKAKIQISFAMRKEFPIGLDTLRFHEYSANFFSNLAEFIGK